MATRFLLTEASTGRFMGLFKDLRGAHAYAQNRMAVRTVVAKDGPKDENYVSDTPKKDPVPPEEWARHYLYRVDEVEVE